MKPSWELEFRGWNILMDGDNVRFRASPTSLIFES
jgi:hypothetical protein